MTPDILITENIGGRWFDDLKARFTVALEPDLWKSPEKIKALLPNCRALIVRNQTKVNADLLSVATKLQIVGRAGAGLDNIEVPAATAKGIVVVSTPDQNSISVAELTLGMMLALARKIPAANQSTHGGGWERQKFVGTELYGKNFGVVGLGRIGLLTALRARALGMNILAHDTFISPDAVAVAETHAKLMDLNSLLAESDFVSCHTPLTPETRHFFNYERFSRMKPTAFFLNLARGEVVDEQGLIRALQEKKLAGAGLDVREQEPPAASALAGMENVILTPHTAAFTREAQERVVAAVCQDVAAVLAGGAAKNFVNFPKPKPQH
ncbi:MAG TPA: hydroxyacid dehydrogenase [Verrucomicrobiae bacterium]|jgi:D-3-phosphoglycerate dehydrogenase|nr:hydroxyacid dehydrogenase [Verrucomicrobiae bacterium]